MNENFDSGDPQMADVSLATNPMGVGNCSGHAKATTNVFEGTGLDAPAGCFYTCQSLNGCTNANFHFGTSDFACYFWTYPTSDTVATAYLMGAKDNFALFGGWELYRDVTAGFWKFLTQVGNGTPVTVTSTTSAPINTGHALMIRRNVSGTQEIGVDGTMEASVAQSGDISPTNVQTFQLGGNGVINAGHWDFGGCWKNNLDDASLRKILVCGEDGLGCTCSGASYVSCPRHTASGGCADSTGTIAGTMAACNQANPGQVD